jgi:predicted TIM-barrel fold metal-dependent hydrolase
MTTYRIISSDSHVVEPADLWIQRVPRAYRERAPKVVREGDTDRYIADGIRFGSVSCAAQTGVRFEGGREVTLRAPVRENVRPGGYIPEEMVKDMDADGVAAQVLYPTVGLTLFQIPDGELLSAAFAAYNGWLAEFVSPFRDRLKGVAMINLDNLSEAVGEIERAKAMGLAGALITVAPPEGRPYASAEYEPFWAAAEDLRMPLSFHVGTNRGRLDMERVRLGPGTATDHWVREALGDMILSGVFERFPNLCVGVVEHNAGWAPYWLWTMDRLYTEFGRLLEVPSFNGSAVPSDFFHRNAFLSFQEDVQAIRWRDAIGVDNLTFGTDYPHFEGTFPKTREVLADVLADCTEEEKAKIAGGNAARIYDRSL